MMLSPRMPYGLHSAHGFFPAWIASSLVLYLTTFFAEIFAADLQSALWNTPEFFDATKPAATASSATGDDPQILRTGLCWRQQRMRVACMQIDSDTYRHRASDG